MATNIYCKSLLSEKKMEELWIENKKVKVSKKNGQVDIITGEITRYRTPAEKALR